MKYLFIFDFDDTLVKTNSKVIVHNKNNTFYLTPAEFAIYQPAPDDDIDYSEFDRLIKPRKLPRYVQRLKSAIKSDNDVSIVTARGSERPIAQFLKQVGITKGVKIVPVNSGDPTKKTDYIEKKIRNGHYTDIIMYDDSSKNIEAFHQLEKKYPNIRFHGHQVPTNDSERDFPKRDIRSFLSSRIKNPETGNDILVKTALKYDRTHPARILATKKLKALLKND